MHCPLPASRLGSLPITFSLGSVVCIPLLPTYVARMCRLRHDTVLVSSGTSSAIGRYYTCTSVPSDQEANASESAWLTCHHAEDVS
jgi:hypothetical protein